MSQGAGGKYNSRQKVGSLEHCHPHHPWDSLAWPQYNVLYKNMVIELKNISLSICWILTYLIMRLGRTFILLKQTLNKTA
jgi:hypothetical protein